MNEFNYTLLGGVLVALGVAVIVLSQILLARWMKGFNKEWED